jgi:hypothetical protein
MPEEGVMLFSCQLPVFGFRFWILDSGFPRSQALLGNAIAAAALLRQADAGLSR